MFTTRYELSPYIKLTRLVFKGLSTQTAIEYITDWIRKKIRHSSSFETLWLPLVWSDVKFNKIGNVRIK